VVQASYFDGRSTRMREVTLSLSGEFLQIAGEDVQLQVPFAAVKIDEKLGRAARRIHLPDGALCEVRDLDALDEMLSLTAHRDGWVDRMQRRIPLVLLSILIFAALAALAYRWALPWTAAVTARHLPPMVANTLSTQSLKLLDGTILLPSKISVSRQQRLNSQFHALMLPEGGRSTSQLLYRRSPQLGANAFTLPDGRIIVLDDLLNAMTDDGQVLAVFGHELGHAHGQHGMRMLLRSTVIGAFLAFYIGDISTLLAAAPTAIVESRYSQGFEWEADDYGARLLQKNGLSPALLADALDTLTALHPGSATAGYLSTHPSTDQRIRRLRCPNQANLQSCN
jgi:Zn-dependent protease with chaperone function